MKYLVLLTVVAAVTADDLPPSCEKQIYCNSELLHQVEMARLYKDSKTFVDLSMKDDEDVIMNAFDVLMNKTNDKPTFEQIKDFVEEYFDEGNELENWMPTDFKSDPEFLSGIKDEAIREYAKDVVGIWPTLGRKVSQNVLDHPDRHSLVPVTNGFIIPGGRFKELYYWDTYWIIRGLLVSNMKDTAKGVIENLLQLLKKFGHIPNGGRWYYQERSQPPMLSAMISLYVHATNDKEFLKKHISTLESEVNYWLSSQIVSFDFEGNVYTMLRYYAPSSGPRPESYYEDFTNAQVFDTAERQSEFYIDIKSAAESGWDFSSRWYIGPDGGNSGNLTNIQTRYIIPVDLNSIFANVLQNMAYFHSILLNPRKAMHYKYLAKQWKDNIEKVLWNEEDGIWYDFDIVHGKHRKYFYPSNVAPLWMGAVNKMQVQRHAHKVINYLRLSHSLDFPGGVPASLNQTGEQWDFPNAWPPLVSIVVGALDALDTKESKETAFKVAQIWVRACRAGFQESGQMFEKYDAVKAGAYGDGGEYQVQNGFGWSNGVVLEFIEKYQDIITAENKCEGDDEKK